jgi:uncharacterized protein (DUF2126 family)
MSIHVALHHVTDYRYDRPVQLGPQLVRLRPAPHARTRVLAYALHVQPEKHFINWQQDPQSNHVARLVFPEKTRHFRVSVDLVAEMSVFNPFDFFLEPHAENVPFAYSVDERVELAPYLRQEPPTARFAAYVAPYLARLPKEPQATVDFLVALNQRLSRDVRYLIRMEPGVQTPEETLERGSGSCRDSGWLLVQILRHLGLAARFVSGYLIQLVPDQKPLDGPAGPSADFTDLHAWAEVYLPGAGWVGLDPTSGLFAGEGHIPLACSPEPGSAAPITGLVDPAGVEFGHEMRVTRIAEVPRVTRPYTDAAWSAVEQLGKRIDERLAAGDVRLTMGGEPTFVSIDDPDGAEWNTAALGPEKRRRAVELYRRLRARYGKQSLVHFGQGKWYPGEQLPRWSLNCFWRTDGEPLWQDEALIADEAKPGNATQHTAQRFLRGVAERLGVESRHVFEAYEDSFYFLWRERRLPTNVDPFDARLDDPLERERLLRVFSRGLDQVVGHVLPVAKDAGDGRWRSGPWFLRQERCYLVPGDSPLGYRLPLDSQPWVAELDYPYVHTPDLAFVPSQLPTHAAIRRQVQERTHEAPLMAARAHHDAWAARTALPDAARRPAKFESAASIVRTALCAEVRNGTLYVFMPPTESLDAYLELVAAIEATAEAMRQPVLLEGYEPPRDPRLAVFRVTPDPGVIEVNIHPSASWDELVERTTFLYDAARETRLAAEKFMIDGRHVGTGGGNHFVLGAATPGDSPWLRRPDLLRSMVSYWHNHPSLSYLFSGLFIGPTSQAPRIDEARNDTVYEIEVAFAEMDRLARDEHGKPVEVAPWLVDRLLRNLLVDVTGNTHRAEFCIDKLYSPDGPAGRLGLLEMRAFEMPPHARMSLAQQLLLRGLVARFWDAPYRPPRLARWGTELHDRFLLPHFVWEDFADVIAELREAGFAFDLDWFRPHFEFRFPRIGDLDAKGITLELRAALEPWHVLGEEGAAGGTVRYVDSSLERLQVRASGLVPERHVVTCNGRPLPMRPTGSVGEFVAGVRYRAWQPAAALHPTIPVHTPLVFDVVDRWSERSVGGCQYHVMHPGGRNYATFPVNAFEAESRRLARFFRMGHTPGRIETSPAAVNPELPFTLDLRRT